MKKFISLLLVAVLMLCSMNQVALAEEVIYPKGFSSHTSDEDTSTAYWTAAAKGTYLRSGMSAITRASTNTINISGETDAHTTCDKVDLWLFVERSTSYSTGYGTYKYYKYSTEDDYSLAKERSNIQVERGYYYRVLGVHSVTKNGITETTDTLTDPISFI